MPFTQLIKVNAWSLLTKILQFYFLFERKKKTLIRNKFKFTSEIIVKNNDLLYSRVTCGEAPACSDGLFAK